MQTHRETDILDIRKGFVQCPVCRRSTTQFVDQDTAAENIQVWCPHCKWRGKVKIAFGQCYKI